MMKFENKSYKKETISELKDKQKGISNVAIANGGFPIFNTCEHTTIDMSNIPNNDMHTLSVKIGDGQYVTLCVMPMMNGNYTNIDVKMYAPDNFQNKAIHFSKNNAGSKDVSIPDFNLMALISEKKE